MTCVVMGSEWFARHVDNASTMEHHLHTAQALSPSADSPRRGESSGDERSVPNPSSHAAKSEKQAEPSSLVYIYDLRLPKYLRLTCLL